MKASTPSINVTPPWIKSAKRKRTSVISATMLFCLVAAFKYLDSSRVQLRVAETPTELHIPSVNLVLASVAADNTSWTNLLLEHIPQLRVVRYVSDDMTAPHHPDTPRKGMEAAIYLSYFRDFYDHLPDVSILIHSHERSWHGERIFDGSTRRLLERLDLHEVVRRGYTNLGVNPNVLGTSPYVEGSFLPVCAADRNRTYVRQGSDAQNMQDQAFKDNFGIEKPDFFLATPGCSQIAVSRDAIRKAPREQFQHHLDWIDAYQGNDPQWVGRIWEYFWQYLFLQVGFDCPRPWRAFCRFYNVCFDGESGYEVYWELLNKKQKALETLQSGQDSMLIKEAASQLQSADEQARWEWTRAVERARDEQLKSKVAQEESYYDP